MNVAGAHPLLFLPYGFALPTYYLVTSIAAIIALYWFLYRAKQKNLSKEFALDVYILGSLSGFFGARAFHILFEEPVYYLESPIRIFEIWRGGFVFYGGLIVGFSVAAAYLRFRKEPLMKWCDAAAPALALVHGLGRRGCYYNGYCYGALWPSGFLARYPTQIFVFVWEFTLIAILLIIERVWRAMKPGKIFSIWVLGHSLGRFVMEQYRDDFRGANFFGLSQGSLISLILFLGTIGFLIFERSQPYATHKNIS